MKEKKNERKKKEEEKRRRNDSLVFASLTRLTSGGLWLCGILR